jgi:perosamine synthetase
LTFKALDESAGIPFWEPVMGEREKELIGEVIDSNFPNDGPVTTRFENAIAEICEVPFAVATTSGTSAIFLGLVACGVRPGDEVIIPDTTFIATASAVVLAGATPVLVDVKSDDMTIDPIEVESAITERTKAIVPVHISGRAVDMRLILDIAKRHRLMVVEDAAEALGSRVSDQPLGSIGDVGCFSFTANKTITTGQGGMVVTNDPEIHDRLRGLKDHGRVSRGTGGADEHPSIGFNFKFTNLQAAMGLAQLETFRQRQDHLRNTFITYAARLDRNPVIRLPGFDIDGGGYPQWVDAIIDDRDSLHDYLAEHGIETRKFWFPLHSQTPYRGRDEDFANASLVAKQGIWLPTAYGLTEDHINQVCDRIEEWSNSRAG